MALRKVKTENGWVEGVASPIPTTTIFKSIPFAAPPVGENRWRAPQQAEDWEGVYQANVFKAVPPYTRLPESDAGYQEFYGFGATEEMDEDCLYLSIWTPAQAEEEKLPVFFHVHGGAFIGGYSYAVTFMGEAFAKQGIIFVTAEYRQGYLGYLAHPELTAEAPYHASGNYGLLDQVAALKWVKRNIAAFGGDPDNITVNGQSAGALSCQYLLFSPLSGKDISKAIMQSGAGFTNGKKMQFFAAGRRDTLADGENLGVQILKGLGVSSIEEARQLPWETILDFQTAHPELFPWPLIDGYHVPRDWDEAMQEGSFPEIPIMLGSMLDEGHLLRSIPPMLDAETYEAYVRSVLGKYADAYLEYNGFFSDPENGRSPALEWNDFSAATVAFCEQSVRKSKGPAPYLYLFTRDVPGENGGPGHSMDVWYSFHTLQYSRRPMQPIDYRLANAMNLYFCNFIKTGDPNGQDLPKWTPYTACSRMAMELGEHIGMIPNHTKPDVQIVVDYIMDDSERKD